MAQLKDAQLKRAADLRHALRLFQSESDRVIRSHGLTPKRYELMLVIRVSPSSEATVTQLGRKLLIGQSAATQLVRRAENEGLIERRFSRDDARVHELSLTPRGSELLEATATALNEPRLNLTRVFANAQTRRHR